jgi:transcriptional regulator of arginine metabolism
MPRSLSERDQRRDAIVEILTKEGGRVIHEQKNLLAELRKLGFRVTQSSVSRDLRDLGAYRQNGRYVLPRTAMASPDLAAFFRNVRKVEPIGPYQTLILTATNAAALIAQVIDEARWPEVGGTFPSANDKVLVLTAERKDQQRLVARLAALMARPDLRASPSTIRSEHLVG